MPPDALANDLWAGPVPEELRDLTEAEQVFISRAYSFTQLRTILKTGDPKARQKGQQGNVVSFPQKAEELLRMLPLDADRVGEFLNVYFTGPDRNVVRGMKQYTVRRGVVERALLWLRTHNRAYVDVEVNEDLLAKLPENAVPEQIIASAVPVPTSSCELREIGPADSVLEPDQPSNEADADADAPDIDFRGAVIDVEGVDQDPVHLWQCALRSTDRAQALEAAGARATACGEIDRAEDARSDAHDSRVEAVQATCALYQQFREQGCQGFDREEQEARLREEDRQEQKEESSKPFRKTEPFCGGDRQTIHAAIPHGSEPIDSYQAAYWSVCFPWLFPYGDACDSIMRLAGLGDRRWVHGLLERADRVRHGAWRLDLNFIAVCFAWHLTPAPLIASHSRKVALAEFPEGHRFLVATDR